MANSTYDEAMAVVGELLGIDVEKSFREVSSRVDNNAVPLKRQFRALLGLLRNFHELSFRRTSGDQASSIKQHAGQLKKCVLSLNADVNKDPTNAQAYLRRVSDFIAPLLEAIQPWAPLCLPIVADAHELNDKIATFDNALSQMKGESEKLQNRMLQYSAILETQKFSTTADDHDDHANRWLVLLCCWIGLLIVGSIAALANGKMELEIKGGTAGVIQWASTRVFLLTVAYYVLLLCNRNYRAHRHLAIVNKHRANAIAQFEAFRDAAHGQEVKNAVLLEATKCIFAPAVTGYLSLEEDSAPSRIMEIQRLYGRMDG